MLVPGAPRFRGSRVELGSHASRRPLLQGVAAGGWVQHLVSAHRADAASLSDLVIINLARATSVAVSCLCWSSALRSSTARSRSRPAGYEPAAAELVPRNIA